MYLGDKIAAALALSALVMCAVAAAQSVAGDAPDGKGLYARYCADCHGQLEKSDVRGSTPAEIRYAMTDRMCGERGGKNLTAAQLEAVARALSQKAR